MEENEEFASDKVIITPRRSWIVIVIGTLVFLISCGLLVVAACGWQLHESIR